MGTLFDQKERKAHYVSQNVKNLLADATELDKDFKLLEQS